MTSNGIAQIVFYAVVLTALAYPLGIYMARVYEGQFGFVNGRLAAANGGSCASSDPTPSASRTGSATPARC